MAKLSLFLAVAALIVAIIALTQATSSVTSVGLALPNGVFKVTNSAVTSSGTLTGSFIDQKANTFLGGPLSGSPAAPAFRALALSDLPADVAYVQKFGAKCDGTTDDSAAFQHADSLSIGAISVPPGTCVIGASITLVHQLVMSPGAVLSIGASAKLSLLMVPIASPQQQIFSGGAVAIFANLQTVYPEWWGAKGDRHTDSAPAIQATVNALPFGGTVQFGAGFYKLGCAAGTAVAVANSVVNLHGAGSQLTRLMPMTNCGNFLFEAASTSSSIRCRATKAAASKTPAPRRQARDW